MGGKKKGKGKKGKKGGDKKEEKAVVSNFKPLVLEEDIEYWVTLDMKLCNWEHMDFKMSVKTATHLFTIKNKLADHHGRIENLQICKHSFKDCNEMNDEMKTLEDYGIKGAPKDAIEPSIVTIIYDFKPVDHNEPLLLTSNADYKEIN